MPGIERINRELARLDSELRANRIDRAAFRARRRQVLLDFEERESTTTPGAATTGETTSAAPSPAIAGSTSAHTREPGGRSAALLVTGIVALSMLVLGAMWFFGSRDGARLATAARLPPATEATSADPAMPQGVADTLMKSAWSAADVNEFLDRWARLSPESVNAASDDPRIWLLRGEAEQRLRAAREAESVDSSPEALARSAQLQRLHDAIRAQ